MEQYGPLTRRVNGYTFGTGPFVDFIVYQLPRINSGEAFFWIEFPTVAVINMSVYGLVTKLRLLGLGWTDKAIATAVCHVYVLVLLPLAGLVVWRLRQASSAGLARHELRLRHAQTWLALLNLASLRSPFVPAPYATFGSLWLLTLLAAERGTAVRQAVLAMLGLAFCLIIDEEGLPALIPPWLVGLTLGIQLSVLALNVWIVQRPVRMVIATQPAAALA